MPQEPYIFSEPELREEYINKGRSINAISRRYHTTNENVAKQLRQYHIPVRPVGGSQPMNLPEAELRRLYLDEKIETMEIAKKLGVSRATVNKYINKYNLPKRKRGGQEAPIQATSQELYDMHHGYDMTLREMAEVLHCAPSTVLRWMREHNIPTREI